MKIKSKISGLIVVAMCGVIPVFAQNAPTPYPNNSGDRDNLQNSRDARQNLGKLERAEKIMGMNVTDAQSQKVGRVRDLALDLQNGRIAEVIITTGGRSGESDNVIAVPPDQFTCNVDLKSLEVRADRNRLAEAPRLQAKNWNNDMQRPNIAENYRYYGVEPYFAAMDRPVEVMPATPQHAGEMNAASKQIPVCYLGEVISARKLMGMNVWNTHDQKIGDVADFVVNVPEGRLVEVVVGSGGFLHLDQELSGVPPQAFQAHSESGNTTLTLDVTKDQMDQAPHFKSGQWSDNPQEIEQVYNAYHITPYFNYDGVSADNNAWTARDQNNGNLTAERQGTSQPDIETTREIRKEITAADGLSVNARNIKVITLDGKVTLRGPVNSQDEKQRLGDIAAKIATAANVNNQLTVVQTTTTSFNQ